MSHFHNWERLQHRDAHVCIEPGCNMEISGRDLEKLRPRKPEPIIPAKYRENETIVELRTKLEIRTWFLRASLALNIGVVAGIVARVLS